MPSGGWACSYQTNNQNFSKHGNPNYPRIAFSGIGGFNLAAEWAVALQIFETINECENYANWFG